MAKASNVVTQVKLNRLTSDWEVLDGRGKLLMGEFKDRQPAVDYALELARHIPPNEVPTPTLEGAACVQEFKRSVWEYEGRGVTQAAQDFFNNCTNSTNLLQ